MNSKKSARPGPARMFFLKNRPGPARGPARPADSSISHRSRASFDQQASLFKGIGTICTCMILFEALFDKGCFLFCKNNFYLFLFILDLFLTDMCTLISKNKAQNEIKLIM